MGTDCIQPGNKGWRQHCPALSFLAGESGNDPTRARRPASHPIFVPARACYMERPVLM